MRVGLTTGDPNGIGVETILKTFQDDRMLNLITPILYASENLIEHNMKVLQIENLNVNVIDSVDKAKKGKLNVVKSCSEEFKVNEGELSSEAGTYSFNSLKNAVEDLASTKFDVLVTAPINKDAITQAGFKFPGHTEYLADFANADDVLMFLIGEGLRIGIVTGHIALKDVATKLTTSAISSKLKLMYDSLLKDFGCSTPKIAVLGLNPHAGDNGLMGNEEKNVISPAIKEANSKGIKAFGPYAADGFFGSGAYKNFDGVLAMYHDQGLAPFKALSFGRGVNFTAGLQIVRTSPDHGTGFDIAGKNEASADSIRAAIFLASDVRKNRLQHREITNNPLKISPPKREYRDSKR
ncbi:MAG: 4-hydroxythreonine-4-phosphate dehydrogenase PdxA [Euryarchaeota archaeon]|nr:4-hydroxythreonine-4-phosphate dehydrogenase PdxA [Euryarchaeota archaeon]|tara:strand:- start:612 stop:1667 length:1056 start_codon:yes stop_codon:yes gene_type:complete